LVAFAIYSAADFIAWRLSWRSVFEESLKKKRNIMAGDEEDKKIEEFVDMRFKGNRILFALYGPIVVGRAVFEFLLPVIVGLYAIISLLFYKFP
jgi:hypothetical protein